MPPSQNPQSTRPSQTDPIAVQSHGEIDANSQKASSPALVDHHSASSGEAAGPITASLATEPSRADVWLRIGALILAAVPLTLLAVASRLEPSSSGLGTHQQLGLPPCSMRVIFGIRCPGCGMTTSWAHFTDGNWSSSMAVNPGGFLLAGFSVVFAFFAMRTCWTGRYPGPATQKALGASILAIAAVTLVNWTVRLAS